MKKLILVNYQNNNDIKCYLDSKLFYNEYTYNLFIHKKDNNIAIDEILVFEIKGNDYKSKQKSLQQIAHDFYCMFLSGSFSQLELTIIEKWFAEKSKRFGLYKEFVENGIC